MARLEDPTLDTSDTVLLREWRRGDRAAGNALFKRYYATVARFFHNKVFSVADRVDLIQRTFLVCVEQADRFRGDSCFRSYLLGIAKNILNNHYRVMRGPRNHAALGSTSRVDPERSPSEVLVAGEEEHLLLAALRRLDDDLQILLELRYWEQLSQREMAEVMEWSDAKVKNQLRRGRLQLERILAELASSPDKLHSTVTRLDDWADKIRMTLGRSPPPPRAGRRRGPASGRACL